MSPYSPRSKRLFHASVAPVPVEAMEGRWLLSGSALTPFDATDTTVAAIDVSASAGKKFHGEVGTWAVADGLPTRASGTVALAVVDWGDGKTTRAKLVDDGSGVVQVVGSHKWSKPGTFQVSVKVEEFPRGNKHQITVVGEGDATATVTPKGHAVSLAGTLTGTYTTPLGNPDARSYVFTGNGSAKSLGSVSVSGTIAPPGFIRSAPATGELTLTGPTGSVTLDLTGAVQDGGSPLPQSMSYTITSGTGAFPHPAGKGTVSISLDDTAGTFVMVIH